MRYLLFFVLLFCPVAGKAEGVQIRLLRTIPYAKDAPQPSDFSVECQVEGSLPRLLAERSAKVNLVDEIEADRSGWVLEMHLLDVHAPSEGLFSGPKWVTVDGDLRFQGKRKARFVAQRISTSRGKVCAVLEKVSKKLSEDIAEWLEHPSPKAALGDARMPEEFEQDS